MVGANCPHTFTTGEIRPSYGGVFTQGRLSERGTAQGKRRDALEDNVFYTVQHNLTHGIEKCNHIGRKGTY
jgi:hypothetical protein